MTRRRSAALLAAAVASGALAALPASAPAAVVTACVRGKAGTFTILLGAKAKKACPKGAKKVRWNVPGSAGPRGQAGAPGAPGAAGPAGGVLAVRDAAGTVLGRFAGVLLQGVPLFVVQRDDGGIFFYYGSGTLVPMLTPQYTNITCTGTTYMKPSSFPFDKDGLLASAAGPARFVYRPTSGGFGAARAWKIAPISLAVAATQLYQLGPAGACAANGAPYTGDLIALADVPVPPDGVGPLTVS